MARRQFTTPMIIRGDGATALVPVPPTEAFCPEKRLQQMLFSNPSLIPIAELEPGFGDLIPIVQELPMAGNRLDILYADAVGHLVLAETKLWRNPQARREVVGQIIEYASELARWSYERLADTLKAKLNSSDPDPLGVIVSRAAQDDFDEARFADAVALNLSRGRFLLLVIGDGIHENVEQMASYLQGAPQLAFSLALLEMALFRWHTGGDDVFVQPRIVARTQEVTRAVIEFKPPLRASEITVTIPGDGAGAEPRQLVRKSLSQEEYFAELEKSTSREVAEQVKRLSAEAAGHLFTIEEADSGYPLIRYRDDLAGNFNFGTFTPEGTLGDIDRLSGKCVENYLPPDVWIPYLDTLARLVPGAQRAPMKKRPDIEGVECQGIRRIPFTPLLENRDEWFGAIDQTIERIRSAVERQAESPT